MNEGSVCGPWSTGLPARAFVGFVGLLHVENWPEGGATEVGWRLERSFWGRGLAIEGELTLRFEVLDLERIISITLPQNAASRRVMEKAGMTLRGETRRRGHEVVWYAVERGDREGRLPPDP